MTGPGNGWEWDDDPTAGGEPVAPIPTGNPYASGEYASDGAGSDDADGRDAVGEPYAADLLDDLDDLDDGDDGDDEAAAGPGWVPDADAGGTDGDAGGPDEDPGNPGDPEDWAAEVAGAEADDRVFAAAAAVPPELLGSTSLGDSVPPPPRQSNRGSRLLVLLVLLGLLGVGIGLERREPTTTDSRVTTRGLDGPEVPPDSAVSTAWYCAAGTANPGGAADETIHVANLSPSPITADVTVVVGGVEEARTARLRIEPYGRGSLPVSDVVAAESPGVVVEVAGGVAVVEHEIRGDRDLAMGPCATEPSDTWYFAAGGTAGGASDTLALLNPFGDDAIVDIAFLTEGGVQEPQALQGFVVGRRAKVEVPVGEIVARQERVAAVVRARSGRVVAEQVRTFDGTGGLTGLALSLGSAAPRRQWTLPVAAAESDATGAIAIANFGLTPTSVEVSLLLSGDGVLTPETVDVPSRSVVRFEPSARIPAGTAYTAVVRSQGAVKVVAESVLTAPGGAATSGGAAIPARRWALAGAPDGASSAVIATNRGTVPITVELAAYVAGDIDSPTSAPAIALAPGKTARFDLDEWGIDPDQVLVVSADGPIVVGRETYSGGVSVALAVPFRARP